MKSKVLVTGSSGFIGKNLINFLKVKNEFSLVTVSRDDPKLNDEIKNHFQIRSISSSTDWSEPLMGVDVVIHLAGIAHRSGTLEEYEEINVNGAIKIAKQAIEAKVKRLIYISSIKVNGEKTLSGKAFKADDLPNPQDSYAKSKYKVESELRRISVESDLEVVIIRPALVYGPGVKSNFLSLMKWVKKRIPLPLGNIDNKRSFVSITNLNSFIYICLTHPRAENEIFLVSDQTPISISELIKKLSMFLNSNIPLFIPFPNFILGTLLLVIGKSNVATKLLESLEVDIEKNSKLLNWQPLQSTDDGLRQMVEDFLSNE
tara:strand:- start:3043 stop:3993 length:951 start_codon:yes stop_codon:yes gene_type:complete